MMEKWSQRYYQLASDSTNYRSLNLNSKSLSGVDISSLNCEKIDHLCSPTQPQLADGCISSNAESPKHILERNSDFEKLVQQF